MATDLDNEARRPIEQLPDHLYGFLVHMAATIASSDPGWEIEGLINIQLCSIQDLMQLLKGRVLRPPSLLQPDLDMLGSKPVANQSPQSL